MGEMRRAVAHDDVPRHVDAREASALELAHVYLALLIALVQIEIDEGRGAELHRRESLIEIARGENARQHVLRQGFARLGMERETAQHAGLQQPVLIKLRGKLDEIARDIRARDARIGDVGQHAMQRMAELVEQCVRVVEADQLRRAGRAFREVHHIDDDGANVAGKFFLAAELRHPGAAALRGPCEVIAKKQRHMFAPLVQDFERAHFRMMKIEPVLLDKAQPEQTLGHMEGGAKADPFEILDRVFDDEYFPAISARSPVVDVSEKDGRYVIEAELPGVSEKDLKVELKDGLLSLTTEKKEEKGDKDETGKWIRRERRESHFSRSFELPEDADGEKIEARFKDGLLTIELPKKPEASPRLVPIRAA